MTTAWRSMQAADLPDVDTIGDAVHPDLVEAPTVFAERLRLHPAGCLVLAADAITGYAVSHPWLLDHPPALDTLLGRLPERAETLHIHDIALLPASRGAGWGGVVVQRLVAHAAAAGLASVSLIAVSGSAPFWSRHGFAVVESGDLEAHLASYGPSARFMVRRLDAR